MTNTTYTQGGQARASIHPDTALGTATLGVADAERSLRFYRDLLGMEVLRQEDGRVVLGAGGAPLLNLLVQPGLRPRPRATTGLYHVAILLPTRTDLAQVLRRLLETRYPIGASDHLVSEALYLDDPDGNGLEIYRDRPRGEWRYQPDGQVVMDTIQLDFAGVLSELASASSAWAGMPAGTRIGHMHLQVGDLAAADAFYRGVLGFDMMVDMSRHGALFLSAGGYHHHLGLNTWHSAGAPPQPPDAAGLRSFVVELPSPEALDEVRARVAAAGLPAREQGGALAVDDPWHNTVVLAVAPRSHAS
jgi:catechol 2,3-dioxygenase